MAPDRAAPALDYEVMWEEQSQGNPSAEASSSGRCEVTSFLWRLPLAVSYRTTGNRDW